MTVGDLARRAYRWIASRSPLAFLGAGWAVFVLGSYPGYLSVVSTLQLYTVRSGDYSDYAPVMTALWSALEYVVAGPFPMLALQSGLFLFGLYGILRKLLSPRAAAITASAVLLFPPVFAPMAVIWPDSLMAGALLAGTAALLDGRRGMQIAAAACFVTACSCHPEVVFALIPLLALVVPKSTWWKRIAITLGLVIAVAAAARGADETLTVVDNYEWRQNLMWPDVAGTLRRAKVKDDHKLDVAFAGVPLAADLPTVKQRLLAKKDALDAWALANGKDAIFAEVMDDDQAHNLARSWKHVITHYPGAYLVHRWSMTRAMLGLGSGTFAPVYDEFGDPGLLQPLHHRATESDWQHGMRYVVRTVAKTPLFRPWLYLVLAIVALVLARRILLLRTLALSGLIYQLTMAVFAPSPEYRFSHWLVTAATVALAALIASRIDRRGDG